MTMTSKSQMIKTKPHTYTKERSGFALYEVLLQRARILLFIYKKEKKKNPFEIERHIGCNLPHDDAMCTSTHGSMLSKIYFHNQHLHLLRCDKQTQ